MLPFFRGVMNSFIYNVLLNGLRCSLWAIIALFLFQFAKGILVH
jgi:hypothetical protein